MGAVRPVAQGVVDAAPVHALAHAPANVQDPAVESGATPAKESTVWSLDLETPFCMAESLCQQFV
jgi:hypothetical protein